LQEGEGGCCSLSCLKFSLYIYNIVALVSGLALLAVSLWILLDSEHAPYSSFSSSYTLLAWAALGVYLCTSLCCGSFCAVFWAESFLFASLPGSGSGSLPAIICTVPDTDPSVYKSKFMKNLFLQYRDFYFTGMVIICTVPHPDTSVYKPKFMKNLFLQYRDFYLTCYRYFLRLM
jgi:hypothetical protein